MKIWSPRPLDDSAISDNYILFLPNSLIYQVLKGIMCRRRDSNPQELAPNRFWVCRVYHFHHFGILASSMSKNNLFVSTIPLYFKECFLKNIFEIIFTFLCARWDSNPQPRRARFLRPLCIPFHHSRIYSKNYYQVVKDSNLEFHSWIWKY